MGPQLSFGKGQSHLETSPIMASQCIPGHLRACVGTVTFGRPGPRWEHTFQKEDILAVLPVQSTKLFRRKCKLRGACPPPHSGPQRCPLVHEITAWEFTKTSKSQKTAERVPLVIPSGLRHWKNVLPSNPSQPLPSKSQHSENSNISSSALLDSRPN